MVETIGCREGRHFVRVKLQTIVSPWCLGDTIPCEHCFKGSDDRWWSCGGNFFLFPGNRKSNPQQVDSSHRQVENRSAPTFCQGYLGRKVGINGSLWGVECSAHSTQLEIAALTCLFSPGHQTDVSAQRRHFWIPKHPQWILLMVSSHREVGTMMRWPHRSKLFTTVMLFLASQYGRRVELMCCLVGQPFLQYSRICEQVESFAWAAE